MGRILPVDVFAGFSYWQPLSLADRLISGQKRTVAVRQARSSEPVGQLVPAGRRETPVLAKAQAGRGDVVFIFANQGGFAPAFKCCLSQKSLVLQNVLIDHIGAMAR